MKAETFFSTAEQESISRAIAEVECKTSGEVAVMVVDQSDTYPEGQILAGCFCGALLALVATELLWKNSLWFFVVISFVLMPLCGWLVHYLPQVKRFFTPDVRLEVQVRQRALTAFYEKGLDKTRGRSGVLFFISLFERKVMVLADKGIYEKIQQEALQAYARDIALGVKAGRAAEILCHQIKGVGQVLASQFPVKPDDINELSDQIIIGQ
ncbi:MAG: hypothetical protein HY885_18535 [Deltaproteobacteria bacterium]|nr:hypothetical protein [Deltaproteobacteria bacterium]